MTQVALDDRARRRLTTLGVLSIAAVAYVDYFTGSDVILSIFYAGPVLLLTRARGRWGGIFAATVGAFLSLGMEVLLANGVLASPSLSIFNAVVRGSMLVLVAVLFGNQQAFNQRLAKQVEVRTAELKTSEMRWQFAIEGAGDGIWDWDVPTGAVFFSARWKEMLGLSDEEIGNDFEEWRKRVHPDDLPMTLAAVQAHFDGRTRQYASEHRLACKDGSWKWILARGLVIGRDAEDKPIRVIGTHTDISIRKNAEADLRLYKRLVESSSEAISVSDPQGRFVFVNPAHARLFGRTVEEAQHLNYRDNYPLESVEILSSVAVPAVVRGETWTGVVDARDSAGRTFPLWMRADSLRDADGKFLYGLGVMHDLTDQVKAETELKQRQAELQEAQRIAELGDWSWNSVTDSLHWSDELNRIFEIEGKVPPGYEAHLQLYTPDSAARLRIAVARTMETGEPYRLELERNRPGQSPIWVAVRGEVVRDAKEQVVGLQGTAQNITVRKMAEMQLNTMLQEKTVLLKEVHHRVKNNLQVISSLLRLEGARHTQPETRVMLETMQGRVRSMALLHEALYLSETLASVDLGAFLRRLVTEAIRAAAVTPGAVRLRLELATVTVSMDQAMPCGILTNELVSNSLKHGFPSGHTGEIGVELRTLNDGQQVCLCVSDTGVGLPDDFEVKKTNSLGMQLVADLARQLGGTLEVGPGPTTVFTVTFPVHPAPLPAGHS